MDSQEAKEILRLYRPGGIDDRDPEFMEALAAIESDPELKRWFQNHLAFQIGFRDQLRCIEVPADLKDQILAQTVRPQTIVWWRIPAWIAAAAAVFAILALIPTWFQPTDAKTFSAFQGRMVRTALREYRVDLLSEDLNKIKQFLADHQGSSDYVLPKRLASSRGHGCAVLRWQDQSVSMICFQEAEQNDLYLFVTERSTLRDAPSSTIPILGKVNKLTTATWVRGNNVYLLAADRDESSLKKYLGE